MSKYPLISIITPLFNTEKYISKTIKSVINQTYQNWELIIIDDKSDDKSKDIVRKFLDDKRIKLISSVKNKGPAKTRNRGLTIAKGRFVSFLDSDDIWLKNKLEVQLNFMIEEKVGFSFTKYNRINWKGEIIGYPKTFIEMPSYEQLTYNCTIGCLTVMIDREICKDLVFPDILKRQDHGLWLLLFKKGIQPYGINKVLASYRVRRNSVSSNKFVAAGYQWRLYRDIMNFKFSYSLIIMVKYLINGIRNRI